jgi:hypothetical protein
VLVAIAPIGRHVPLYALALVLRLGWPTTLGDAGRDWPMPERLVPATQDAVRLECEGLEVSETVAARILAALGRPVACTPRGAGTPAPGRAR